MVVNGRRNHIHFFLPVLLACFGCQSPAPDVEANKAVVQAVYDAIDAQDYDRLAELIAEDFQGYAAAFDGSLDRDASFELIRNWYDAFPDFVHVVETMVAEGDRVVARLTYHGTHQGEFEGVPATGKRISYEGVQIFTVVDGVIKDMWVIEDGFNLMLQLGMQLVPAEQGI